MIQRTGLTILLVVILLLINPRMVQDKMITASPGTLITTTVIEDPGVITVQAPKAKENWLPVEVSHYSNKEKGLTDNNCIGGKLVQGDYALPYDYPVGTKFKIKFPDGHIEDGRVMDRGSPKYIKTYQPTDSSAPVMKIDRFMKDYPVNELLNLGVIQAQVLIEGEE